MMVEGACLLTTFNKDRPCFDGGFLIRAASSRDWLTNVRLSSLKGSWFIEAAMVCRREQCSDLRTSQMRPALCIAYVDHVSTLSFQPPDFVCKRVLER